MATFVARSKRTSAHQRDARQQNKQKPTAKQNKQQNRKAFNTAMEILKWKHGLAIGVLGFKVKAALNGEYAKSQQLAAAGQLNTAAKLVKDVESALTKLLNAFLRNSVEFHQKKRESFVRCKVSEAILKSGFDPAFAELVVAHTAFVAQIAAPGLPDYDPIVGAINKLIVEENQIEERIARSREEFLNRQRKPITPILQMPPTNNAMPMIHDWRTQLQGIQLSA